jgi:CRP-like cAMP-binding protein
LDGYMHRYKVLANGKRQIIAFHVPGDIPDLCGLHVSPLDFTLAALVPSALGLVAHEDLQGLFARYPGVTQLLWRDSLLQASIAQAWMLGLGRRSARSRLSHLFCELFLRSQALGLSDGTQCPLPTSQIDLADALGLTTVHLNRTLQALRRDGLVAVEQGCLTILNWARLKDVAGFNPGYLHLMSRDRTPLRSLPITGRLARQNLDHVRPSHGTF